MKKIKKIKSPWLTEDQAKKQSPGYSDYEKKRKIERIQYALTVLILMDAYVFMENPLVASVGLVFGAFAAAWVYLMYFDFFKSHS